MAGPKTIGPADKAVAVTPHNTNTIAATRALYVGGAGDLKVDMLSGVEITFVGVAAGTVLPIRVSRVYATGTTATYIIALY